MVEVEKLLQNFLRLWLGTGVFAWQLGHTFLSFLFVPQQQPNRCNKQNIHLYAHWRNAIGIYVCIYEIEGVGVSVRQSAQFGHFQCLQLSPAHYNFPFKPKTYTMRLVRFGSSFLNAAGNSFFHSFIRTLRYLFILHTFIFLCECLLFRASTHTHAHFPSTELCVIYEKNISVESVLSLLLFARLFVGSSVCLSVCLCVCVCTTFHICLPKHYKTAEKSVGCFENWIWY